MINTTATYRIQFHKEFTFTDFERIINYLVRLGAGTVYASPIFEATPGSTHGYDALNPHRINPEIGNEEQLKQLSSRLRQEGISWLQDIVPNHMAFSAANPWLMDVLEKGLQSAYAPFFDTVLTSDLFKGRIMVPFLGAPLDETIEKKEIKLDYRDGRFVFNYFDALYPLNPRSYGIILWGRDGTSESITQLLQQLEQVRQIEDPQTFTNNWNEFLLQLSSLMKSGDISETVGNRLHEINNDTDSLLQLLDDQDYRLCNWQETDKNITLRRFFIVNGLISLNIHQKEVFDHFHQYISKLLNQGLFGGLRVDHIDGLLDPSCYLERLRQLAGQDTYLVVEKILEPGEALPKDWPIEGNTGYDFLALVNNLLTLGSARKTLSSFYEEMVGPGTAVQDQIHEKKAYILQHHMAGELDNIHRLLLESGLVDYDPESEEEKESLKRTIGEFLIQCPVYRYYGNKFPLSSEESQALSEIFRRIRSTKEDLAPAAAKLEHALLVKPLTGDQDYNARALYFYQRCMQFTGPLMAKGVEDTLMYTYNCFIGHNEVGDSPEAFGLAASEFHSAMQQRQDHWPLSLNATSTHDTKRGEDVRTRLNVISELSEEWVDLTRQWMKINKSMKGEHGPDANDEYLIYQTILGTWPVSPAEEETYPQRIKDYLQKALREAKVHSDWAQPDEKYEEETIGFALKLVANEAIFRKTFDTFSRKITDFGIVNSLVQTTLKFTCPGIPDIYQGCELWDLSMVDPDNRRPVDFGQRESLLDEIDTMETEASTFFPLLWEKRLQGHIKLWLTRRLLAIRKEAPALFEKGSYIPLEIKGFYKEHIFAFARKYQQNLYLVAVPLYLAALCKEQNCDLEKIDWKDTAIILPEEMPPVWEHLLIRELKIPSSREISVNSIMNTFPAAILKSELPKNERGAGILCHITSLPSSFGIGDFGPEARNFVEFLARAKQKYWQILPLTPTEGSCGNSPYSSYSSMAGNPLLISPELLAQSGLLQGEELPSYYRESKDKAEYAEAEKTKDLLFRKAFATFEEGDFEQLKKDFEQFCEKEKEWLDDFALYVVIKQKQDGKPWYQWPDNYKLRNSASLEKFAGENYALLKKARWLQFLFARQWHELKAFANHLGIKLFGDMPFYVSYDSADVWAHPDIFSLDENGNITGVAGVPPDYFNENGQLWGMPVFKWEVLRKQNYDWWIKRIRKNIELFDLLRFDHFRAFSAYWEVPAGEETAKNGSWKPGPGSDFFEVVQKQLGKLPFVAEDLGEIDQPVYDLRDAFGFPGMKVLQFAFGEDMPHSQSIPHGYTPNFFVYTGTHDNNTTRGWFRKDADKAIRKNVRKYIGQKVKGRNVHQVLSRMAYASVAKTVILPIQDVLGLDESARMNSPASTENNWLWRLQYGDLTVAEENWLRQWVLLYGRE